MSPLVWTLLVIWGVAVTVLVAVLSILLAQTTKELKGALEEVRKVRANFQSVMKQHATLHRKLSTNLRKKAFEPLVQLQEAVEFLDRQQNEKETEKVYGPRPAPPPPFRLVPEEPDGEES